MNKIFYLEDNEADINLTNYELKKAFPGCAIDIARTIGEATSLLKENSEYDVAILDLNLPDGNGMDILLAIRHMNLPTATIILTSSGDEEAAIAALKAGADDYLVKNYNYYSKLSGSIISAFENFRENIERLSKPIKVLYVEWNKSDIDFTLRHMRKYAPHIKIEVVTNADEFLELIPKTNLETCNYDVLLLDYRLPGLNALDTIKIIRKERNLPISIVVITGHGSEEVAVQTLKMGANEYLVKRQNYLFRLPSLITSAYQRQILEQQQKTLLKSESKYRLLADNSKDVIFILNMDFNYIYVSPAVKELRGYEVEEVMKQNLSEVLTAHSYQKVLELITQISPLLNEKHYKEIEPQTIELEMNKKDGTTIWTEVSVSVLADEQNIPIGIQGAARDISQRKAAREELFESREEYRKFFEDDLTGDFISTVDGKLIKCNPAYLQIIGFESMEQALNYDLIKLRPNPKDRFEMIEALKKNKKLSLYEHELIRIDGKKIHVIANIIGGFDKDGNLSTIKGYIFDDTKRRKALEELRKLSRAIEQSPASVIITDTNGNIEYVNPKFCEVTGFSFDEVNGKNPRILKSGNLNDDAYDELWKKITNGETWKGELQNRKKDGTLFWESASISPVKNESGEITHYLAVKEDISDKKKHEEELIIARDKAQESDRLKSAFLATMSHELRTPLNAIIGFSGLVDEKMSNSEIVNFSKIINKSGNHLLNIIEDIFTVSLLQTGHSKVAFDEFNLFDFIKSLIQYSNIEAENRDKKFLNIKFQSKTDDSQILIRSDKTKIFQVLINFIKNAIEYTSAGDIEVGFKIEKEDVIFFVKDTGIGIPADKVNIIFERFRQVDDTHTRLHGGVGLGLAICTEIAKLLNGKVWVESELGKGSSFFFSLKNVIVRQIGEVKNDTSAFQIPDFTGKTILIVEDDETNYILLENYIKRTKASVLWVDSGEKSIEICHSNQNIDLVLMDIRMPGLDGSSATLRIKENRPNLPVIAQTAYALADERRKILNSNFDDYISKPIAYKTLFEVMSKFLI